MESKSDGSDWNDESAILNQFRIGSSQGSEESHSVVESPETSFYEAIAHQCQSKKLKFSAQSIPKLKSKCAKNLKAKLGPLDFEYNDKMMKLQSDLVDDDIIQAVADAMKVSISISSALEETLFEPIEQRSKTVTLHLTRVTQNRFISAESTHEILQPNPGSTSPAAEDAKVPEKSPPGLQKIRNQRLTSSAINAFKHAAEKSEWAENEFVHKERQEPPKKESLVIRFATKVAKVLTLLLFGGGVIAGGLIIKATILILANAYSQNYANSPCVDSSNLSSPIKNDERYEVMLVILTCLCFPDALSLLYALWRMIKKTGKLLFPISEPDQMTDILLILSEILDAIGRTFLILMVIPTIDATLSVNIFSFIAFVPAILQMFDRVQDKKHSTQVSPGEMQQDLHNNKNSIDGISSVLMMLLIPSVSLVLQLIGIGLISWQIWEQVDEQQSGGIIATCIVALVIISPRHWVSAMRTRKSEREQESDTETNNEPENNQQNKAGDSRYEMVGICSILKIAFTVSCCFLIHFVIKANPDTVSTNDDALNSSNTVATALNFTERTSSTVTSSSTVTTSIDNPDCNSIITAFWNTGITNMFVSLGTFYFGTAACQTKIKKIAFAFPLSTVSLIMSSITAAYTMDGGSQTLLEYFGIPASRSVNEFIGWKTSSHYSGGGAIAAVVVLGFGFGMLPMIAVASHIWQQNKTALLRVEDLFEKSIFAGPMICEDMVMNRRRETERSQQHEKEESGIPVIMLCITMWHENYNEMKQILTSVMRLDKYRRRYKDKFNFEVHVFFDSAIEKEQSKTNTTDNETVYRANEHVERFMNLLSVAADIVDKDRKNVIASVKMQTPYGGRIQLLLPQSKSPMYIHLKDARKIRKKKRWSQCMYLGYLLRCLPEIEQDIDKKNLFLLALDGDVDFQPEALLYLLVTMQKDKNVGAACGRIHPIGNGPVVWFQKFEYAVGHWLQKSAEDILGCVLCSPGCFSLFRGSALADANVAGTYLSVATEAHHKIQWDQGEDRWLCTLLLKKGYKIEFCAASDSYTFAPEDIKEFYNQRRRWGPSTMANILDILLDARVSVKNNENISWGYIAYQMGLMAASILGPSTVVLIVQGALQYVFAILPGWSLVIAITPVVYFTVICYTTSADFQVRVATILTLLYALIMMTVLVGVIGQITTSVLNPTSIFTLAMVSLYAFTGLIHPTEWTCLIHGALYYVCVPSAFIFLPIYSYCNMDNVSWGTREVKKLEVDDEDGSNETGQYSCGWGNICQCHICIKPKKSKNENLSYETENEAMEANEKSFKKAVKRLQRREKISSEDVALIESRSSSQNVQKCYFKGPRDNTSIGKVSMTAKEEEFWRHLIRNHLKPENEAENRKSQAEIQPKLKELKNKMSGSYLFVNCMWLTLTFSLTLVVTDVNVTIVDKNGVVTQFNPLSFLFLIFFLVILTIQFVTMLFHRWDTFLLRMADTNLWILNWINREVDRQANGTNEVENSISNLPPTTSFRDRTDDTTTFENDAVFEEDD